jgi:hypothetical protein
MLHLGAWAVHGWKFYCGRFQQSRIFGRWHNRESAMIAYVGVQCFAYNKRSSHQFHNPWTLQKGLKASKYAQSNKSICCKCTHADSQRAFSTGPYLKKTVPKWLTVNKSWPGHVSLPWRFPIHKPWWMDYGNQASSAATRSFWGPWMKMGSIKM